MLDPNTPSPQCTPSDPYDLSHPIYDEVGVFPDDEPAWPTDQTSTWRDRLQIGQVVLFVYPIRLPGDGDHPKTRPCLVLELETRGDTRYAVLAYGTSAHSGANRGYEITVSEAAEVTAAGLTRPTRFVGSRRLWVPLASPGFRPIPSTASPVIGHLGPNATRRMHAVRGRIHAEADIARERRAEARRERQERRTPLPISVERIGPPRTRLPHPERLPKSATPAPVPVDYGRHARSILSVVRTPDQKGDRA